MSLLNTPPPSRRSIKTYLSEIDMDVIRTAINLELDREDKYFMFFQEFLISIKQ